MLQRIQKAKQYTKFDFRDFACPDDPLKHLFEEWTDYYQTKFAICHELAPTSICEIGVRYGYSAIAFLTANPNATYLGIDNNSQTFGRAKDAITWAKKITNGYSADFLLSDTQKMQTLPGDFYDLVHVDGQQDGDATFHDMELALEKSHWILVDGFFWSRPNMLSATFFLEKYRHLIKGAHIIPGYAGELLIETKSTQHTKIFRNTAPDHSQLCHAYDYNYYLRDCGGYTEFKSVRGKKLTDARLVNLYHIAQPKQNMRILDIGCGRGELAFTCYQAGASVIGVDYSQSAIDIAKSTFHADCGERLQYIHTDILDYQASNRFDLVIAGDFVEHVSPSILERVLLKVKSLLKPNGRFIIHTWPNRLAYEYQHQKKRHAARQAGSYLPKNPRTYYEDLMHINEQTPARLKNLLQKYFPHVLVWVGNTAQPLGSLENKVSLMRCIKNFDSIFAIASDTEISIQDVITSLSQQPLDPKQLNGLKIDAIVPDRMKAGTTATVIATVQNNTNYTLGSLTPFPIHYSYHWYQNGKLLIRDGLRTDLMPVLKPKETRTDHISIQVPNTCGIYEIVITLVQERCFWFDDWLPDCSHRARVTIY